MVDALGAGQVVYASDYPHFDAKFPESARVLIEGSGLGAATLAVTARRTTSAKAVLATA